MVTFEEGSDITRLTVTVDLIDDDLDEQDIQEFQVWLEIVTAMNPTLLSLRDQFTGQIQDDEGTLVLLICVKVVRELRMKTFSQKWDVLALHIAMLI